MGVPGELAKKEWRDTVADAADRLITEWDIESLPADLHRNNFDYYYLSVWPGMSGMDLAADITLPDRPPRTGYAYIHIPFCSGVCSFCSYFLLPSPDADNDPRVARYVDDLLAQALLYQDTTVLDLSYVYLGGGTPGLLHPDQMERLLSGFAKLGALSPQLIGTIELHPEIFADVARMQALADVLESYGIKRVSLGLQSDDPTLLSDTNRRHNSAFLSGAMDRLRSRGFTVNIDLMYGMPGQSLESWLHSLQLAVAADPDSISTYFTFIDPGTLLRRKVERDPTVLSPHALIQQQHLAAQVALQEAGYYELPSDFYSKPSGDPSGYSQQVLPSASNMIAFGAGAYGYYPGVQYFNYFDLGQYHEKVRRGESPIWRAVVLTPEEELCRDIMFSLKNAPALDLQLFAAKHGISPLESHARVFSRLADLDLLRVTTDEIRLTAKGRLVVEEIACLFIPSNRHGSPAGSRREAALLRKHNFVPTYGAPSRPGRESDGG